MEKFRLNYLSGFCIGEWKIYIQEFMRGGKMRFDFTIKKFKIKKKWMQKGN